jgi:hypothetical protein
MKVTIYVKGYFGVTKQEATLFEHGRQKYAQYENAPFVVYKKKRARKKLKTVQTFRPFLLIVEGWGQPEPPSAFSPMEPGETAGIVGVQRSKYSSCDSRYETDFNATINPLIESGKVKVVGDYRWTTEVSSEEEEIEEVL